MARPVAGITVSGLTSVRSSLRGLSDSVEIQKMDKQAAQGMVEAAREEVPTDTHQLQSTIRKKRAIQGYKFEVGSPATRYARPVMAHESKRGGKHFVTRAIVKSRPSRLKIYEKGMKALIIRKGFRTRR